MHPLGRMLCQYRNQTNSLFARKLDALQVRFCAEELKRLDRVFPYGAASGGRYPEAAESWPLAKSGC